MKKIKKIKSVSSKSSGEIKTVNVIEYFDDSIQTVHAFPETKKGNQAAEDIFAKCVRENAGHAYTNEELGEFMTEGYFQDFTYIVYLVHSYK